MNEQPSGQASEQPGAEGPANAGPSGQVPMSPDQTLPAPPPAASGLGGQPPTGEVAKKDSKWVKLVPILLVALAFIGFRIWSGLGAADQLEVGQCVQRQSGDAIKAVECSSTDADFKVLKIQKDTTEGEIEQICSPVDGTTMTYFEGEKDSTKGNVICLGAAK